MSWGRRDSGAVSVYLSQPPVLLPKAQALKAFVLDANTPDIAKPVSVTHAALPEEGDRARSVWRTFNVTLSQRPLQTKLMAGPIFCFLVHGLWGYLAMSGPLGRKSSKVGRAFALHRANPGSVPKLSPTRSDP